MCIRDRLTGDILKEITIIYGENLDSFIENVAEIFMISDLPLSFFTKFSKAYDVISNLLKVIEYHVRKSLAKMRTGTSKADFRRFKHHLNELKKELKPKIERLEKLIFAVTALLIYITLNNAEDYYIKI